MKKFLLSLFVIAALLTLAILGHLHYFYGGQAIVDLPANVPIPQTRSKIAAIVLSGDMGFNTGMARKIAHGLTARGIPVTGVDSRVWFRERRTPQDIAALINSATYHALNYNHADRVVLIGQSFGADVLHVGLTGLVPDLRPRVLLVGLVVPTDTVYYRTSPAELFELAETDALALPTANKLDWVPVICVYGVEEEHSLCPLLRKPNVVRVALPGGHNLRRKPEVVINLMRSLIWRTLAAWRTLHPEGASS